MAKYSGELWITRKFEFPVIEADSLEEATTRFRQETELLEPCAEVMENMEVYEVEIEEDKPEPEPPELPQNGQVTDTTIEDILGGKEDK